MIMDIIDKGHLHPKLKVPGVEPGHWVVEGEHSRKLLFQQLFGTSAYEPAILFYNKK